jgi:hypothetical protein
LPQLAKSQVVGQTQRQPPLAYSLAEISSIWLTAAGAASSMTKRANWLQADETRMIDYPPSLETSGVMTHFCRRLTSAKALVGDFLSAVLISPV